MKLKKLTPGQSMAPGVVDDLEKSWSAWIRDRRCCELYISNAIDAAIRRADSPPSGGKDK